MCEDVEILVIHAAEPQKSVYAMHRNDILVKSNEHWLKERYTHSYLDTLNYMLIDGEFRGVVVGKFLYTPEVEDVSKMQEYIDVINANNRGAFFPAPIDFISNKDQNDLLFALFCTLCDFTFYER